jgi:outer membrane immunogenic protein
MPSRAVSKETLASQDCSTDDAWKISPLRKDEVPIRRPGTALAASAVLFFNKIRCGNPKVPLASRVSRPGGFNWQNGPWVAGIEADVQFSHQRNGVNTSELQITNTFDFFSTLRGRVGYAMDEWLFYLTAGGGYGSTQASMITTCRPPPVPPPGPICGVFSLPAAGSFSGSDFSPFWVAGVGVETQIWDRWTGRIEYLYLQSGSVTDTFAVPGGTLAASRTVYDHIIRTGLNYHF